MWIYNFEVPFTNNLSERGLRGVKLKQKASRQFWNIESAKFYATIRTYIETCQRNKVNVENIRVYFLHFLHIWVRSIFEAVNCNNKYPPA